MTIVVGLLAAVMFVLLAVFVVAVALNRRRSPGAAADDRPPTHAEPGAPPPAPAAPAAPSPLAAWAREQGLTVAEPPLSGLTFPAHAQPARLEPLRCLRVVGDVGRDGFEAQTWAVRLSAKGGLGLDGDWQVLTVPVEGALPDFACVHVEEIVHAESSMPQRFAAGPLDKRDGLAYWAAPPEAAQRLAPLAGRIAATRAWVVVAPGSVTLSQGTEPDAAQLQERVALAREVAAALGA